MNRFWSPVTRDLSPYVPGEQPRVPGLIKLNTNEHPEEPSAAALAAIRELPGDALRRYPDPESLALRQAIASQEGLSVEQVFVGNGSDEVLAHVFQALLSAETGFSVPDITYSFYPVWARLYGLVCEQVPLDDGMGVDLEGHAASPLPILLANPNAPTGTALDLEAVRYLVGSNPDRLVVIDEAYYGFGADTAAVLLAEADNLLITRTLSKSHALAGLRVGYALGSPGLIEGLVRVKDSFNSYPLDALAQRAAQAAVEDSAWLERASASVIAARDRLAQELGALDFEVCPSKANFLFARHRRIPGRVVFDALREANILVRRWDKPRIEDYLRITVGTEDQCRRLVEVLGGIVGR